jgi:protein-arginine kinase activator protein McsA
MSKLPHGMVCDRCSKPIIYEDTIMIESKRAKKDTRYQQVTTHTTSTDRELDLCEDCYKEFKKVLYKFVGG